MHASSPYDRQGKRVDAETALIPRLDAKEVAAVFSAPFHNFLRLEDEETALDDGEAKNEGPEREDGGVGGETRRGRAKGKRKRLGETEWYKGAWTDWHETQWRMHNFFVPVQGRVVSRPRRSPSPSSSSGQEAPYPRLRSGTTLPYRDHPHATTDPLDELHRFRVFGMTARILVDCARVAYAEDPEFEHNSHFGDEELIRRLVAMGRMEGERGSGDEFEAGDLKNALGREKL